MFNYFLGSRATTKASLLKNRHQKFVCCDLDSDCIQQMDIEGDESICRGGEEHLSRWKFYVDAKQKPVRKLEYGLHPFRTVPFYLTQILSNHFYYAAIFERDRHLLCRQCSGLCEYRLYSMYVTALLIHKICVWGVAIMHSSKQHQDCGMGCDASRPSGERKDIEYHYTSFPYFDLGKAICDDGTYGEW